MTLSINRSWPPLKISLVALLLLLCNPVNSELLTPDNLYQKRWIKTIARPKPFIPYYTGRIKVTRKHLGNEIVCNGNVQIFLVEESKMRKHMFDLDDILADIKGTSGKPYDSYHYGAFDIRRIMRDFGRLGYYEYKFLTADDGEFLLPSISPERCKMIMVVGHGDFVYFHETLLEPIYNKKNLDLGEIAWKMEEWDFSDIYERNPEYGGAKSF